jgi:predicted RND superfamily exporter protein
MSTSLALGGGFLLLGLSGFQIDRTLGLCTAYIVLCGLVVDLVLVPRVLVWLDERAENQLATESSR